jgi:transcriptional regulator with XRE-family HTH domain
MRPRASSERSSRRFKGPARYARRLRTLGLIVRAARQSKGWTLEQAAARMNLDFKHLQKIEAGTLNVTFVTLLRLADGLGERPGALMTAAEPVGGRVSTSGLASTRSAGDGQGGTTRKHNPSVVLCPAEPSRALAGEAPGEVVRRVGRRIAELRRRRGLTQLRLAEAAGASVQYVRKVEAGENLTIASLSRFAALLCVSIEELFVEPQPGEVRRGRPPRQT